MRQFSIDQLKNRAGKRDESKEKRKMQSRNQGKEDEDEFNRDVKKKRGNLEQNTIES